MKHHLFLLNWNHLLLQKYSMWNRVINCSVYLTECIKKPCLKITEKLPITFSQGKQTVQTFDPCLLLFQPQTPHLYYPGGFGNYLNSRVEYFSFLLSYFRCNFVMCCTQHITCLNTVFISSKYYSFVVIFASKMPWRVSISLVQIAMIDRRDIAKKKCRKSCKSLFEPLCCSSLFKIL